MANIGVRELVVSLLDITGLKKVATSVSATILSFGVTNSAQLISIAVGIVAGVMAIRHYALQIKLAKAQLEHQQAENKEAS